MRLSWRLPIIAALTIAVLALSACQTLRGKSALTTVDVVTLNLWHDKQDWPRRQDRIVAELRALSPDVILLQEVLQDTALPNQAQVLAARLGYRYRFFSVDAPERARRYGNAILTKAGITQSGETRLRPLDDYRNAGWVRTEVAGEPLKVYVTHLHHTPEGRAIRAEQIGDVIGLIEVTADDAPSVIGGDFNTRSDAPELAPLHTRFFDAYAQAHAGRDVNGSAHATLNPRLGHAPIRIDHVFAQRDAFRVVDARIILDRPDPAGAWPSDHYGLWVRLARTGG